jgi:hypothetical protein
VPSGQVHPIYGHAWSALGSTRPDELTSRDFWKRPLETARIWSGKFMAGPHSFGAVVYWGRKTVASKKRKSRIHRKTSPLQSFFQNRRSTTCGSLAPWISELASAGTHVRRFVRALAVSGRFWLDGNPWPSAGPSEIRHRHDGQNVQILAPWRTTRHARHVVRCRPELSSGRPRKR